MEDCITTITFTMVHFPSLLVGCGVSATGFLFIHQQLSHRARLSRKLPLQGKNKYELNILETQSVKENQNKSSVFLLLIVHTIAYHVCVESYEFYRCSYLPNDNNSNNNSKQAERSQQDNVSSTLRLGVLSEFWIVL